MFLRRSLFLLNRIKPQEIIGCRAQLLSTKVDNESNAAADNATSQESKRDHRTIGVAQKLFTFHPSSPGAPFFLPHGTIIFNRLLDHLREQYRSFGYQEVRTPLVFNSKLWETSGHLQHYKENMYFVTGGDDHVCDHGSHKEESRALKPMNCPAHCLIFSGEPRSHAQLPLRLADFSPLHRNELTGALSGLSRVRQFHQDDGHIFCTPEQVVTEVASVLQFVANTYSLFNFDLTYVLSTRPNDFAGELTTWNEAESMLQQVLENSRTKWHINPQDGAFYGPKIDVQVKDAIGRSHQTATVQLDFQLPKRFNLQYTDNQGLIQVPVIIHRAIFGSLERFLAILMEHIDGNWPLWLSPRQITVCPIKTSHNAYANQVAERLKQQGFEVIVDDDTVPLNRKIRNAEINRFNFVAVVGDQEANGNSVHIRGRGGNVIGAMSIDAFLQFLIKHRSDKTLDL